MVTWSSSDPAVATITQGVVSGGVATGGGLASTLSAGTATIQANFTTPHGDVTGSTTLTVVPPDLVSIVILDSLSVNIGPNPVAATIAKGTSHQFLAYGIYTDGGERILPNSLTTDVTWDSTPATVATISNVGRANGISVGTATITATANNTEGTTMSGTTSLNVTDATLSRIIVSPLVQTIAPLTRLQFAATGVFGDSTTQDFTSDANWASSDTTTATVSNAAVTKGLATGVATGLATISAAFGSQTGNSALSVGGSLTSIALTPSTSGVAIGSTLPLMAVGTFSDGTTRPINLSATWSVTPSDNSIATVDSVGVVTGVATGTATVQAQVGAVSMTAVLNVQDITSLAIQPPVTPTLAQGTQTQFVATATLADATTQDITSSVTWTSSDPTIATVSDAPGSAGLATAIAPGAVSIGASFGLTATQHQAATQQLTTTNATLSSLAITSPATPADIALGQSQQYVVTGTFSDATTQDLSNQVTWTSSDPTVAVITRSGLAISTGVGTTTVTAAGDINGATATATQDLSVH
jgi:uncharacterized protein YjdB